MEASDIRFNFLDVFIIETLSKYALSISRFVVSLVTSVSSPPITPAKAMGLSSATIIKSFFVSFRFWLSKVKSSSESCANLTEMLPKSLSLSKACRG